MHLRLIFLIFLLLSNVTYAFDLKGISVGSTATPELVFEKLGAKCGVGANGAQVCNGNVTIGRESARMNLVINGIGIVQRIDLKLNPSSFEVLAPLLIEKFGAPTHSERSELTNRMGAKFEQITHHWKSNDETEVRYQKYAGTLDASSLYFSTKDDRELLGKGKANRRADI